MKKVYTIYDKKAEKYLPLALYNTDEEVKRSMLSILNDKSGVIAQYPQDFEFYFVGTFNEDTGHLEGHSKILVSKFDTLNVYYTPSLSGDEDTVLI